MNFQTVSTPSGEGSSPIKPASLDVLMRVAFEAAPNGMIIVDETGTILMANTQIERFFGYTRQEIVGQSIDSLLPERFRKAHQTQRSDFATERRARAMGSGRNLVGLRKDGTEFPVEIGLNPVALETGVVILASIIDVTARVADAEALRDREERLRAVMEHVVDAVVTIDERGIIQSANPATEQLFGYPASELLGRNVSLLMPEPHRSAHDAYIANYLATGNAKIIGIGREVNGRRKDGSTFAMDLAVSEFQLGNTRYFTGLARDITGRKAAAEQLKFYADELQAKNDELLSSNQALDDFAYIASHDLKEPLRGIHNYASFLLEDYGDKLEADGHAKLETIGRLAQRLEDLINTLLAYSRVGRVDLAIHETDLHEVVSSVLDSLAITLQEKGVEVRIPKRLPRLRCDEARIAEVFRNLITNAIKYNDKPSQWIEIGSAPLPPPQGDHDRTPGIVAFYVRDNGIGIREKHLDAVFRIFKRLHARDQYGGGTGAGLTIVRKIVERHGGRIWVESEFGHGSTFYFTLASEE